MANLAPFEGHDVLGAGVSIRNAGDGLSEAMSVDPVELHHGQEVTIAVRCTVDKVRFDPVKDTDGVRRIHVLKAGESTIIDDAIVAEVLDAQRVKIEEARGIQRLPMGDTEGEPNGESGGEEASVAPIDGKPKRRSRKSAAAAES